MKSEMHFRNLLFLFTVLFFSCKEKVKPKPEPCSCEREVSKEFNNVKALYIGKGLFYILESNQSTYIFACTYNDSLQAAPAGTWDPNYIISGGIRECSVQARGVIENPSPAKITEVKMIN